MDFYERFFAQHKTFVLKIAIFFIYLLLIYPACPARGKKSDDSTCTSHRFFFLSAEDASRAERSRVSEILLLLQKASPPNMYSFARTKEYQKGRRCPQGMKTPVGLLSRRPVCKANAACSARQGLRYFRGAGGTNQGLLALDNPKAVGLHTKNPSRFAKGFFVLRRFQGPSVAVRQLPAGERAPADAATRHGPFP